MLITLLSGGNNDTISVANDNLTKRLLFGIIVSILANVLLWAGASQAVRFTPRRIWTVVEITRVTIDKQGQKQEKVVTKQQIAKKVAVLKKEIQQLPQAEGNPPAAQEESPLLRRRPGAIIKSLTAQPTPNDAHVPDDTPTVLAGGNAAPAP